MKQSIVPIILKLDRGERLTAEDKALFAERSLKITEPQITALREAFTAHPNWKKAWIFFDGHVEGDDEYGKSLSQPAAVTGVYGARFRLAGLVSIATKGVPMPVPRIHPALGLVEL